MRSNAAKPFISLALILAGAFLMRLLFLGFDGFHNDVQTFEAWALTLRDQPFSSFYARAGFADYPPGYLYVLALLARIYGAVGGNDQGFTLLHLLVKLPGIMFDLVDAALVFVLVRRFMNARRALVAAACVAFNPAFIFISAYWGQVDSVAAAFVLIILIALDSGMRSLWSPLAVGATAWTALAISVLIKPPALLLAPLLIAVPIARYVHGERREARLQAIGALFGVVLAIAVTYALSIPFAPIHTLQGVAGWLIERYQFGSNVYPYNTINAFNIYAIAQPFWEPDSMHPVAGIAVSQATLGAVLVVVATLAFAIRFILLGTPLAAVEAAALTLSAFFLLATRMHERYIFDAVLLMIILSAIVRRYRTAAIVTSITLFINLLYSLQYLTVMTTSAAGVDPRNLMPLLSGPCAALNTVVLLGAALQYFQILRTSDQSMHPLARVTQFVTRGFPGLGAWFDQNVRRPNGVEGAASFSRTDACLAVGLSVLSFVICFVNYARPGEKIFDEIYYARSGEEYLRHVEQFEWTHPPLTKLIITLSMILFGGLHGGDNASGWRFLNLVVGALMVGVLYAFTKRLSKSTLVATAAGAFLAIDGFHLAQSRIATPEITVAFFCLLTIYLFYNFWLASDAMPEERAALTGRSALSYGVSMLVAAIVGIWLSKHIGIKVDPYVSTWIPAIVLSIYFMSGAYAGVRLLHSKRSKAATYWLLALTISAGCLAACKWNGLFDFFVVWACAGVLICSRWFTKLRTFGDRRALPLDLLMTSMLFVGGTIYVLSYIPYFLLGHSFFDVLVLQHSMYAYHSDLRATHPYSSAWWQWPILQRPISYYYHDFRTGLAANKESACCVAEILALPNPLVWWLGLISLPAVAVLGWLEKRRGYILLVLTYFLQWLPWIASPRIAFEYHFFPNLAIICCCDALLLQRLWESPGAANSLRSWQRLSCIAVSVLVIAAFIFWYPIAAGTPITYQQWYDRVLTWVPFVHWI